MIAVLTQCFPPDRGGIETTMGEMAMAFHKAGHPVVVLADHIRGGAPERDWPFPVRRFGGPRIWRRWRKSLALAALGADVVWADSWKSLETMPARRPRVVVMAHGNELLRREHGRGARMAAAFSRADVVVANSYYTTGLMAGLHDAVEVVNPSIRPPLPASIATRPGQILSLGRLEARKGFDMVIRALPGLSGAHYTIAGDGPDAARLRALAAECGVAARVAFTGAVDEATKSRLLGEAAIFAMPVRREARSVEGFGLVYLEAAWFGVPSLAGLDGGAADAVLDGETGLLVEGADPMAVRHGLARLLEDPVLRQRLGDAARERVHRDFTWEAVLPRYLMLLERSSARSDSSISS
jgi:phosphatidylinositol alpha-1,6-mannosyltransferase